MSYFPSEEIALIENDETTNFFRRIFYCWTNDLVKKGYRKQLNSADDLCALPGSLDTSKIYDQLPAPRHQDFSLAKFLFSKYGTTFILLGILKLFGDIVRFMNLILLPVLIDSFDKEKSIEDYSGFKIASLMGLILFVSAVADFNFNFLVNKIALQIRTATQLIVYEKLLRVSSVSFSQANFTTGKLLNLVSTDIDRAVNFFTSFHSFWSMPLNLCIALFLLYREVNIAFISGLISAAILIPINKIVADMIGKMSRKMMNLKDERLKLVNEFVRSTKAVKLNNWERFFEHKITAVRNEELKYLKWRKYLDAICVYMWASAPVVITLSILVTFVLLGGELTAAKIFTSISLVNVLIYPLNAFPWVLNSMIEALVSKRRFDSLLSLKEIEDFAIISDNSSTGKFLLRLNDVSFSWTNERLIIRNLKLSAEKGQVIGIMGPVGSGKSTILQGILGETLHRAIDDIFAQKPIEFCRDAIANGIGYVGQESWLRQGTVKENILSGSEYDPEFYNQVIHACALLPDIEAMPGRDELMLSNNGGNLSGGQRTRIELARAVYQRCGIYVLDDPFASVDSEVAQHIFRRCIKGMLKQSGAVVILCTHHTNFLTEVDWLLKLGQNGSVIQQGTPKEIFAPDHIARCDFALSIEASQINNTNSASADQELGPEAIVSEHVEEKQQGTVKIGIYIVYIRAVGIFLTVAILLSLTAMQLTKNGSDAWLGYWTGHSANATMELSRTLTFMLPDSRIINFLNPLYFNGWSEQISSILKQFTGGMDRQSDHFYLMVYVIIAISNTFCTLARAFLFAYGGLVGARVLHQRLLRRVSMAKLTWWDKNPFGRVINRLSSDVFMVDDSLPFQMNILLAMAFNLFGSIF